MESIHHFLIFMQSQESLRSISSAGSYLKKEERVCNPPSGFIGMYSI